MCPSRVGVRTLPGVFFPLLKIELVASNQVIEINHQQQRIFLLSASLIRLVNFPRLAFPLLPRWWR